MEVITIIQIVTLIAGGIFLFLARVFLTKNLKGWNFLRITSMIAWGILAIISVYKLIILMAK